MIVNFFMPHLPSAALSPNSRQHWGRRASAVKHYRTETCWYAKANLRGTHFERAIATVQVYLLDPTRRRDVDNYGARLKALWDGLVDAGVLPDDSATHLTIRWAEPPFVAATSRGEGVAIELEEMT